MTNGEKIIAILKPRKDQIRIYDNWVEIEIQKLGINFSCELDWWNTECNEPTTKNNCAEQNGCITCSLDDGDDCCRKLYEESMQQLLVDCVSRQAVDRYLRKTTDETIAFYENFLDLPSVAPQETTLTLDKIREEIGKTWHTKPKNRYEEGLKDQALKDMQIIDKYKIESEDKNDECK